MLLPCVGSTARQRWEAHAVAPRDFPIRALAPRAHLPAMRVVDLARANPEPLPRSERPG
jgi:hypothetical protein